MVYEALKSAGVVRGVDEAAIRAFIEGKTAKMVISRGEESTPGNMETMEWLFVTDRGKPWKQLDGGQIELKRAKFHSKS